MAQDKRSSVYFDRDTLLFMGLDNVIKKQLSDSYPYVDIDQELNKMGLWLTTPKGRRRVGNIGFIIHWLNNANPSVPDKIHKKDVSPIDQLLDEYLGGVWKKAEHILTMNATTK